MTAQRPPWPLLAAGIGLLALGTARLTRPHDWASSGGFLVALGAACVGLYVDRALRWLKDRR